MSVPKIAAISISGLGISGLGIFGTYKLLEIKTVEAKLLSEGYTLLKTTKGDTEWTKVKNENNEDLKKKSLQEFINKNGSEIEEINIQKLRTACEILLKESPTEKNMNQGRKYCSKRDVLK